MTSSVWPPTTRAGTPWSSPTRCLTPNHSCVPPCCRGCSRRSLEISAAAFVLSGPRDRAGWWGTGRPADWTDAVEVARVLARAARTELTIRRGDQPPWHPGRCAELELDDRVIGYAGELHPRVVTTLGLPERTCAMELDLGAFQPPPPAP